ncbi:MAG: aminoglycoside phosphotransferase family protein [Deltaproteobacteria bacterium]|jgi:Ser/Thr protein kinase RdoA (MazF antagonist)|nr:aminoglycoside phosphotransferase family protein [Deltaproteobacteria bacterium]
MLFSQVHLNFLRKNYSFLQGEVIFVPLKAGLINDTWLLELSDFSKYILQRVSPIFPPEVNIDIARLTDFLKVKKINTISILPTDDGSYYIQGTKGIFRILSWCSGRSAQAEDLKGAAAHLGSFHRTLEDFTYKFRQHRDIHNTSKYLQLKNKALAHNRQHPVFSRVEKLVERITERLERGGVPEKYNHVCGVVHGDPKPDNFLITGAGPILIDLDTAGRHSYFGEIGDFLRSWCRRGDTFEREAAAEFFKFYLPVGPEGIKHLLPIIHLSCETIALELSLRFAIDTLEEKYFKWDKEAYDYAWQHNLQRAEKEFAFAQSVIKERDYLKKLVTNS